MILRLVTLPHIHVKPHKEVVHQEHPSLNTVYAVDDGCAHTLFALRAAEEGRAV